MSILKSTNTGRSFVLLNAEILEKRGYDTHMSNTNHGIGIYRRDKLGRTNYNHFLNVYHTSPPYDSPRKHAYYILICSSRVYIDTIEDLELLEKMWDAKSTKYKNRVKKKLLNKDK